MGYVTNNQMVMATFWGYAWDISGIWDAGIAWGWIKLPWPAVGIIIEGWRLKKTKQKLITFNKLLKSNRVRIMIFLHSIIGYERT